MSLERLNWEEYACFITIAAQSRSEDPRTQVGACILNKKGRVLATGFNGWKAGMKVDPDIYKEENRRRKGKLIFHAETNALKFLKDTDEPYLMASLWSPCESCARQIAARDTIQKVIYVNDYMDDREFIDIFKFYNVECVKLSDDGLWNIRHNFLNCINNAHYRRQKEILDKKLS